MRDKDFQGDAINFTKTLLSNFSDKYKKRVLRYLYRSIRLYKKQLKKELGR